MLGKYYSKKEIKKLLRDERKKIEKEYEVKALKMELQRLKESNA